MDCILLFLKAPTPGKVKTRLAASIGFKEAAELYSAFVLDWCDRLYQLCDLAPSPVTLRVMYSPPEAKAAIADWLRLSQWGAGITGRLYPQSDGDLGDRLHQAFVAAFDSGAERAIAVGTDSPDLPLERLTRLLDGLRTHDCGLIPSTDGGYCAIGFHRDHYAPAVFQDMAWSTETVCGDTLAKLQRHQRTALTLEPWVDVDNREDLQVLIRRLEEEAIAAQLPRTSQWLMNG
ncbi:MAG: TIGR04282 family arsenosugar biosynthesis glycosyltransferase [Cyanobacteria bacterium P01_H01_bin.130]